jgi:hypothetical protein
MLLIPVDDHLRFCVFCAVRRFLFYSFYRVEVRSRTLPTVRLPFVGEVSANFFAVIWCRVVSVTDPYDLILCFLDLSQYFFFQVAPQLY